MDFNLEEECKGSSNDNLADEYLAAVDQGTFQLGFSSSKPGKNDKNGDLVITIIDRSSIHEIGVKWCCCPNAAECNIVTALQGHGFRIWVSRVVPRETKVISCLLTHKH